MTLAANFCWSSQQHSIPSTMILSGTPVRTGWVAPLPRLPLRRIPENGTGGLVFHPLHPKQGVSQEPGLSSKLLNIYPRPLGEVIRKLGLCCHRMLMTHSSTSLNHQSPMWLWSPLIGVNNGREKGTQNWNWTQRKWNYAISTELPTPGCSISVVLDRAALPLEGTRSQLWGPPGSITAPGYPGDDGEKRRPPA